MTNRSLPRLPGALNVYQIVKEHSDCMNEDRRPKAAGIRLCFSPDPERNGTAKTRIMLSRKTYRIIDRIFYDLQQKITENHLSVPGWSLAFPGKTGTDFSGLTPYHKTLRILRKAH